MTITIKAARDAKAGVWYIADSDLPGLNLEGESLDELYDKLFHGIEEITGEALTAAGSPKPCPKAPPRPPRRPSGPMKCPDSTARAERC